MWPFLKYKLLLIKIRIVQLFEVQFPYALLLSNCHNLNTQIQRKTEVSRSNTIGKSICSKHGGILIRNTAQLHIGFSLLIRSLQVKVGIRNTVRHANIPRRTLSIKLHLKLLNHLLLLLQKCHGSTLLLWTLHLNIHKLLPGASNIIHDGLKMGSLCGILPIRPFPSCLLCLGGKLWVGLQHCLIIARLRYTRSRSVHLECLLANECELAQVKNLKGCIECCFKLLKLFIVGCSSGSVVSRIGCLLNEFLKSLVADGIRGFSKWINSCPLVYNFGA